LAIIVDLMLLKYAMAVRRWSGGGQEVVRRWSGIAGELKILNRTFFIPLFYM
jgi:hypothetical protein